MIISYIYIYAILFILLIVAYRGIFNLPVIFFTFYSVYNFFPAIGFMYFDTDWDTLMNEIGDIDLVEEAFKYHFYGALSFSLACFLSKLIWHEKKSEKYIQTYRVKDDLIFSSSVTFVIILLGVFLTGQIYGIGSYGTVDAAHTDFSIFIHFITIMFMICSLYVYSCLLDNKLKFNLILFQIIFIILMYLIIGNRGMIVGMALILIHYFTRNKPNIVRDIFIVFSGYITLILVQIFRAASNIVAGTGLREDKVWIEGASVVIDRLKDPAYVVDLLFNVQGDKIGIFTAVIEKVNQMGLLYGYTYLESIPRLIPSILRRPLGIPDNAYIFDFHAYIDDCEWCAFSLNGELFMNFGLIGIIVGLSLIGIFFGMLHERSNLNRPFTMLFMLNMFPFITALTRNSSDVNVKLIIYTFILTSLLYVFHVSKIKRDL